MLVAVFSELGLLMVVLLEVLEDASCLLAADASAAVEEVVAEVLFAALVADGGVVVAGVAAVVVFDFSVVFEDFDLAASSTILVLF